MDTSGLLSELDAVNILLSTIGESRINSLDATGVDVAEAKATLQEVARKVQEKGWNFNEDLGYPLPADINGEVPLPANTLKVDVNTSSGGGQYIQRGYKLYDRLNQTYKISRTMYVDIVLFIDFDLLPQAARSYIAIRAARLYQKRILGSEVIDVFTQEEEYEAKNAFLLASSQADDLNMFSSSVDMVEMLRRD